MKLESISRSPAIITFKRGTVIEVDHFRIIKPKRLLIMGVGEGSHTSNVDSLVGKIPEFGKITRVKTPSLEELIARYGENNRYVQNRIREEEAGHYDAKSVPRATYKFQKILTANIDNVLSIKRL